MSDVFAVLGLSDHEENVYVALVDNPSSTLRDLSHLVPLSTGQIQRALSLLRTKGLLTETPTRPRAYLAAAPEAAVEMLVLKREEELQQARLAATHLADRHRSALDRVGRGDLVELLTGSQSVGERFVQLMRSTREEILVLDRPPYAMRPMDPQGLVQEKDMLDRGVRIRGIYSRESLETPGRMPTIESLIAAGEEARVLPDLPTKLAIFDRRTGLIPLDLQKLGIEDAVVVHASFLLHALIVMFESLWEKATPLRPGADTEPDRRDERHGEILQLLATGLKDESIARILGLSRATMARRMRELLEELGARTRFQAGILAERKIRVLDASSDPDR